MPQVIASRRAAWRRGFHVNNGQHDPGVDFLSKLTVRRVLDGPVKNSEASQRTGAPETRPFRTPSPADK
jgi:hypothetical protein